MKSAFIFTSCVLHDLTIYNIGKRQTNNSNLWTHNLKLPETKIST